MDEHRIGLHPILKPIWAPRDQRLVKTVNPAYEWIYLYAFVCPESGQSRYWIVPEVTRAAYSKVMSAFAESVQAGKKHHVLVVEDNAGFHGYNEGDESPEGIEVVRLPPYSPELQPVERMWELTDQTIANKCFKSIKELIEMLGRQCMLLETQLDRVTRQTLFHWWPLLMN